MNIKNLLWPTLKRTRLGRSQMRFKSDIDLTSAAIDFGEWEDTADS